MKPQGLWASDNRKKDTLISTLAHVKEELLLTSNLPVLL